MRILVLSDIHNDTATLRLALKYNSDADAVFFLGDGINNWESVMPIRAKTAAVRGNCDGAFSPYPLFSSELMNGVPIYMTHGHSEHVKYGLRELEEAARSHGAQIALFGHTHNPEVRYEDGLYLMNPGSVRENSCGIIDITSDGQVMCYTKPIISADMRY